VLIFKFLLGKEIVEFPPTPEGGEKTISIEVYNNCNTTKDVEWYPCETKHLKILPLVKEPFNFF
jgi:hypothetical protein